MKLTDKWLKEFLATDLSLKQLCEKLTSLGLEVDSVQDWPTLLNSFEVAEVTNVAPHPQADRLSVCKVRTATQTASVVCGASNVRPGLLTIFAPVGSFIPKGAFHIQKTTLRGVESCGMLCSFDELGLDELFPMDKKHIASLPTGTSLDTSVASALELDLAVIHVDVTPNRPDLMGVYGIVRELAAAGYGTLKPWTSQSILSRTQGPLLGRNVTIDAQAKEGCPFFALAAFENVDMTASLPKLQRHLQLLGVNTLNLPVDLTNVMTYGYNRPLHVFDADTIQGNIIVRLAQKGEHFEALNGTSYQLLEQDIVIADDKGVLALGGIIGGARSAVNESTHNIYMEAAFFDPIYITRTARRLSLVTDAALRFERGVDPASLEKGLQTATALWGSAAGQTHGYVLVGEQPKSAAGFVYDPKAVQNLSGLDVPFAQQQHFLEATGFNPTQAEDNKLFVTPPSWRFDIENNASIVEDVLRLRGYEHIPATPLPTNLSNVGKPILSSYRQAENARAVMVGKGFCEVVTWSFIAETKAATFAPSETLIALKNPISQDMSTMRPSLIPGLLETVLWHQNNHLDMGAGLFEVGVVYQKNSASKAHPFSEDLNLALVIPPPQTTSWRAQAHDVWRLKGHLASLLKAFHVSEDLAIDSMPEALRGVYHPGQSGAFVADGQSVVTFGALHPKLLQAWGCAGPLFVAELCLKNLASLANKQTPFAPSIYQPMVRDLGIVVPEEVTTHMLQAAIKKAVGTPLHQLDVFDVFQDAALAQDKKKSIALRLSFLPTQKGATDAWAEDFFNKALKATQALGAQLRRDVA